MLSSNIYCNCPTIEIVSKIQNNEEHPFMSQESLSRQVTILGQEINSDPEEAWGFPLKLT